jgi:hypothetical protein
MRGFGLCFQMSPRSFHTGKTLAQGDIVRTQTLNQIRRLLNFVGKPIDQKVKLCGVRGIHGADYSIFLRCQPKVQSKVAGISSLRGGKRQSHPEKRMDCHGPLAPRNDENNCCLS